MFEELTPIYTLLSTQTDKKITKRRIERWWLYCRP